MQFKALLLLSESQDCERVSDLMICSWRKKCQAVLLVGRHELIYTRSLRTRTGIFKNASKYGHGHGWSFKGGQGANIASECMDFEDLPGQNTYPTTHPFLKSREEL